MPRQSSAQLGVVLLTVAVLMTVAAWLQGVRDREFPRPVENEASLYITSGNALRHMSGGYTALAADLYWIRAIQYYGGTKLRLAGVSRAATPGETHTEFSLLYPMLDLTTTLDPSFNLAYRFGSIFLAEPYPGGAGRPDLAVALLEKGFTRPTR